jgi:hypothetical protein
MTNCNGKPCLPSRYSRGDTEEQLQSLSSCPGVLEETYFNGKDSWNEEEGCIVEICPNSAYAHRGSNAANYCGNGADVLTLFRSDGLSREEKLQELTTHLEDF